MREQTRDDVEAEVKKNRIKIFEWASLVFLLFLLTTACSPANQASDNSSGAAALPAPSGTNSQVSLAWNANAGEQQGFYIEQSTDGINFNQILMVPDGTNTATIAVSGGASTYYFRIRGYNQAGTSPYTAVVAPTLAASN